jgi:MFS family permease
LGTRVQNTATLWLVYELTDSPLHLGLIGLARGIPTLALSIMGGIISDRVDRRKFIMFGQAATGALSLILAVLTATGVIRVWHIYSITLISSSLTAIYTPARTAIIPSLVPRDLMLNAFALTSTVWKVAHLAGPALAGGIIVFLGVSATYLINGAAHVVTLFALAAMQLRALPEERHPTALRSLMETISFIRRESIIVVLMAMDFGAVYFGTYRVLLPVFARNPSPPPG